MSTSLELVTFRLRDGYAGNFPAANAEVTAWLSRQPGFLSRHLAQKPDGGWIDAILWASRPQAWSAAQRLMREIGDSEAMRAIDPDTLDMSHSDIVVTAGAPIPSRAA